MKIKWLGHASFLITSNDGTTIITDPYQSANDGGMVGYEKITQSASVVTVSHEHGDHNSVNDVQGNPALIRGLGSQEAGGIEFRGVESYHDTNYGSQRGPNTLFCFSVDGIRICHLGDLGHQLSQSTLDEIGEVDLLLAVAGGGPTIDLPDLNQLVEAMGPKVVIPMHFTNNNCTYTKYTAEDLAKGKDTVKRTGTSEVEFSSSELPQNTEVVILNHAL
ncbi:MAG: L-ascorbate metabolism protein UlaG, beta-lactamase superfamily [Chloroflexi bacterium]|jgi:L-ascorbate metabolism protein UlaG (beta-lactamase superfamily)|nr:MAG: L-ascorbate metabolism protein UlaG, beta-lactamase superfamily [Chloroflexota bacterium]